MPSLGSESDQITASSIEYIVTVRMAVFPVSSDVLGVDLVEPSVKDVFRTQMRSSLGYPGYDLERRLEPDIKFLKSGAYLAFRVILLKFSQVKRALHLRGMNVLD